MLREEHAGLHVWVVPGLSTEVASQVERGALDAAITTRLPVTPKGHEWRKIADEPMQVIASAGTESEDVADLLRAKPYFRFSR